MSALRSYLSCRPRGSVAAKVDGPAVGVVRERLVELTGRPHRAEAGLVHGFEQPLLHRGDPGLEIFAYVAEPGSRSARTFSLQSARVFAELPKVWAAGGSICLNFTNRA